jgi:hypothetical protein
MSETFDLPVHYKDRDLLFPARLLQTGYTHKFEVDVYGTEVLFEPDEEKSYRAIVDADGMTDNLNVDILAAIAQAIEDVLK